ncbi:unnamed protein product [Cyprideis torosa]|uniref:Uncharacterized protein n=1 Tax=Cyprideis torosa TaxID=163714 RepID=A0A7R8WLE8_9CRUS|nr:unnamed protein product [Cyprideis torosa]CAG0904271.1 unnamed protein product [Cyprideis torosa]
MLLFSVLFITTLSAVNGLNLEINDIDLWLDYFLKGYRGIVIAGNETHSWTFSVFMGDNDVDDLTVLRSFLLPEGVMVYQLLVLDVEDGSFLSTAYYSLSDFEIIQELKEELTIGQTARLFLGAASVPEPPVYATYESIKEAIQTGKELESFWSQKEGSFFLFPNLDTRIMNEGTADEYIEVVVSSAYEDGSLWYPISIYANGLVMLRLCYFDVDDDDLGCEKWWGTLGQHWTMREVAGFLDGGRRITTFEEMKVRLFSGLPTDMVLDNTQCQVQGDDDILGENTLIQRRAIKNWEWFAGAPGNAGEAIQLNYFQFAGDKDPFILHENIDIDVNRALVHISLINMRTQSSTSTVLVCELGTGAWMESKVEGERTQLTSVEDLVEAASSGYTMAVSVSLDACTDENGDPAGDSIVGTSADFATSTARLPRLDTNIRGDIDLPVFCSRFLEMRVAS